LGLFAIVTTLRQRNEIGSAKRRLLKGGLKQWPSRLHAVYVESITRLLNVFEEIDGEIPFNGLRWFPAKPWRTPQETKAE
jgi:hypothetical protein